MPNKAKINHKSIPNWIELIGIIFILMFIYISTQSIPFYFEDIPFIQRAVNQPFNKIIFDIVNPLLVGQNFGFLTRPVELFSLKMLHLIVGYQPTLFHVFKSVCLAIVISAVAFWIVNETSNRFYALLAGILIVTACPIYQSSLWICDFEIVAQIFVVISMYLWYLILSKRLTLFPLLILSVLIILLALVGNKTKASALVIPMVIFISSIPFGKKKISIATLISIPLTTAIVAVRIFKETKSVENIFKPENISEFVVQIPIELLIGLICLFLLFYLMIAENNVTSDTERMHKWQPTPVILFCWIISAISIWSFLPSPESRYLTTLMIPLLATIAYTGARINNFSLKHRFLWVKLLPILIIMFLITRNLILDFHFRGYWGSKFIAIQKTIDYINTTYRDTLSIYKYWRPMFYVTDKLKNNYIVLYNRPNSLDQHGLKRDAKGNLDVSSYSEVFLLSIEAPISNANALKIIPGSDGGIFDIIMTISKLKPLSLRTMKTLDKTVNYPINVYIYRLGEVIKSSNDKS